MRILHSADWHIGKTLFEIPLLEDQQFFLEEFYNITRTCKPDVIIVAGDIYDRSVPSADAIELLNEYLTRILLDHKRPIIMISGNHDGAERLGFGARFFESAGFNLVTRPDKGYKKISLKDDDGVIDFFAIPYMAPEQVRDIFNDNSIKTHADIYKKLIKEVLPLKNKNRKVAIAHAFISGSAECDSERLLSIGGSDQVSAGLFEDFHFTALGHLHRFQSPSPHVHYSGSPLKYSISEVAHKKSVSLIEINRQGQVKIEPVPYSVKRDMARLEGSFDDIYNKKTYHENENDFLAIYLEDDQPVFDAIGRLRDLYPHIIHVERVNKQVSTEGFDHFKPGSSLDDWALYKKLREYKTGKMPEQLSTEEKQILEKEKKIFNKIKTEIEKENTQ